MSDSELIPSLPLDLALDCLHRVPLRSLPALPQVCRSWRSLLSSPSFFHARRAKGYQHHHACVIHTTSDASPSSIPPKSPFYVISTYDEKQNAWAPLPPLPDSPHGIPLFCSCVSLGSQIVLLGGWDPSSWSVLTSVYIFDFVRARWRRGAPMPTARSFFACAAGTDGKIVVAGGHDDSKNALRSAEVYDVSADVWESLPDMSQERDECKAACFNGKLFVVSGFGTESQGQFVASAESFDFTQKRWETEDNFWPAERTPASVVSFKEELYALLDGHLVRFKAAERVWEPVAVLPATVKISACATALSDGILVLGLGGNAEPANAARWCVGTAPSWRPVDGNANLGIIQHAACTVQV